MRLGLRSAPARFAIGLIVTGLVAAIAWYAYEATRPGRVNLIRPSYAFDVGDREQLAGYADNVFVGRVVEIVGVDDDDKGPYTIFRVSVEVSLKGDLQGTALVRQLGGKVGKDVWLVENDEQLAVGSTYVLVTSESLKQAGAHMLLAGPISHQAIKTQTDRQSILDVWREAIRNQRTPDALHK